MQDKVAIIAASMASASSELVDMSFLEEAIYELLRARRILCGAYVYGFYLEDNGYNKTIFEFLQVSLFLYWLLYYHFDMPLWVMSYI